MRKIRTIYHIICIMLFVMCSCSSNNYYFKDSIMLKKEKRYSSGDDLIQIKKTESNVVVDNDTLNEPEYRFLLPKNSKSYKSVVNSIPSVHIFSYRKNQYLAVLKIEQSIVKKDLLNIDKDSFLSTLEKIGDINYTIDDLKLSSHRKFDILVGKEVLYLILNKKEDNLFKNLRKIN